TLALLRWPRNARDKRNWTWDTFREFSAKCGNNVRAGSQDGQWSSGDPILTRCFQVAPELSCITTAFENVSVKVDDTLNRSRVLVQEFDPQVPGAMRGKARKVLGCGLRHGVEEGVPATHIRPQGMLGPDPVAQLDVVAVARPAAVGRVRAGREERTI